MIMPFYDPKYLSAVCSQVLGADAWGSLTDEQRRVLLEDVEIRDAQREAPSPTWAAELLRLHAQANAGLASYADELLDRERRRREILDRQRARMNAAD